MAKWEYRVCAVPSGAPGQVEEQLNGTLKRLSEEGWRFVETIYGQNLPLLLFKQQSKSTLKFTDKSDK